MFKVGDLVELDFVAYKYYRSECWTDIGIVVETVENSNCTTVFWQKRGKYEAYCPTVYLRLVENDT